MNAKQKAAVRREVKRFLGTKGVKRIRYRPPYSRTVVEVEVPARQYFSLRLPKRPPEIYWTARDGRQTSIRDMDAEYLRNTIALCLRRLSPNAAPRYLGLLVAMRLEAMARGIE